jgi:G protein-coupled receptor Mth (Methuselah protein)
MGINWVMEVVSWAVGGPDYIWYITDIINTLQGVFIFCIFVLEPRVKECVWKRWGPKLSQILGHRGNTSSHVNVPYSTPEEAVVRTDM